MASRRRLSRDARCRSRSSARCSSSSRRLRARWSLPSRLARQSAPQTRCVDLPCGLGVNMQRHSVHRLRFGIERSVDKPAPGAEFPASFGTNRVAHAANAFDGRCEVDPKRAASGAVRTGAVDQEIAAGWIRERVPLKGYVPRRKSTVVSAQDRMKSHGIFGDRQFRPRKIKGRCAGVP